MYLAHLGVAIFILGVSLSEGMKTYYEGVKTVGSSLQLSGFDIKFQKLERLKKQNWLSETGIFSVEKDKASFKVKAERRVYLDTGMPSSEAGIKRNFFSHLYIVMGQEQPAGSGKRVIRIYHNPYIILIWLGSIIMAFGGLLSFIDGKFKLSFFRKP